MTGSVQCNGGNDATLTADAGGTPSGQSSAALRLRGEQIWFQLCLAPRALVTLDHTELRYRMRGAECRPRLLAVARHARRSLMLGGEMLLSRQAYLCFIYPTVKKHGSCLLSDADGAWLRYCFHCRLGRWRA
ncbi:hypothetical protein E2C01_085906 [Portunus trituberculatus]|uniref:Uncharacterized protein n=1 Tax=Portunus trituberculatus TaxID=210409 RepID=A0A5B7J3Y7_PORTR|nr:hypothetical protein [Portunus trituberculatus]